MTLDELLTRETIKELRYEYSDCFDRQDLDGLMALFTDDAVCDFGSYGTWQGRAIIRENYAREMPKVGEPFDSLHIVTNPRIKLRSATEAYGRWYLTDMVNRQPEGGPTKTRGGFDNPLLWLAIYEDEYRRVDGRWLISYTKLSFLWPARTYTGLLRP